jgi:Flp pilus assembly protein TadG
MRGPTNFRFHSDRRGAIAVEFGLLLPIMVLLLCGAFELTRLARASSRAANAAQTIADLISQQSSVSSSSMANFCAAGRIVMIPFLSSGFAATAASVTYSGTARSVDWQDTTCGNATSIGTATALATNYTANAKDSVIIVRVSYSYTPVFSTYVAPSLQLTRLAYVRPRNGVTVTHS